MPDTTNDRPELSARTDHQWHARTPQFAHRRGVQLARTIAAALTGAALFVSGASALDAAAPHTPFAIDDPSPSDKHSAPGVIIHRPAPNAGPDINPLKGWNSGWWRDEDFASVGFQYLKWGDFEPTDDEFDWGYVEDVIARPGSIDRHLVLRLYVDWAWNQPVEDNYHGPGWLLDQVGEHVGHANPDDPGSPLLRATRYDELVFIAEAQEAIEALIDYFEDDPRIFVLQVGVVGFWGEWHTHPRNDWKPSDATRQAILGTYLDAMGPNLNVQLRYPHEDIAVAQPGLGYHNDYASPTPHGYDFAVDVEKHQLWRDGPIGGEWPPGLDVDAFERMFETDEGMSLIEDAGYSLLKPPSAEDITEQLPGWTPDGQFMDLHRRFGYQFQIREARHRVSPGRAPGTRIEIDLANVGIAPFYRDWNVELALLDATTGAVVDRIDADIDLRTLGRGQTTTIAVDSDVTLDARRTHHIGLRIVQPGATAAKTGPWALRARNVYVVVANDVDVVPGVWGPDHELTGGWNIVGDIHPRTSAGD